VAFEVHAVVDRTTNLWQLIKAMPKVELHRHLEGAIRLETLVDVAKQHHIPLPTYELEVLRPYVQMTAADPATHLRFLSKFHILRQFFISEEVIRRVTQEAVADAAEDNIRYMELRFTPYAMAKLKGFTLHEVVQWVTEAVREESRKHNITVNLIIAMNRHENVELGERMMRTAVDFLGRGVVGIDLCGNEVNHRATPFIRIFEEGHRAGLGVTVHAGEWEGPENVIEAIERFPTSRIGHGVRAVEDSRSLKLARENNIFFEVCPTSNLQTGVAAEVRHHQLTDLHYLKAKVTLNTDDPAICNTTLTDEMALVVNGLGLSLDFVKTCIVNGALAAFLPDTERLALADELRDALSLYTLQQN